MKRCIIFEVSGPFRWFHSDHAGSTRRWMFAWFSIIIVRYSWTEFLQRYAQAAIDIIAEREVTP